MSLLLMQAVNLQIERGPRDTWHCLGVAWRKKKNERILHRFGPEDKGSQVDGMLTHDTLYQ